MSAPCDELVNQIAVMFVDAVNSKGINGTAGHPAGGRAPAIFGKRSRPVTQPDEVPGRF